MDFEIVQDENGARIVDASNGAVLATGPTTSGAVVNLLSDINEVLNRRCDTDGVNYVKMLSRGAISPPPARSPAP